VDARRVGVGSKKGTLKFTNALDTTNHVIDGEEAIKTSVCEVNVDTLDSVVAAVDPVLIKIDVEGFETEVIAGAKDVLSKTSLLAVIMELNGSGQRYHHDEDEVYKRMIEYGFSSYNYDPYQRSLKELNGKNHGAGNTLFVRDVAAVRERLQTAPAFTVMGDSL